MQGDFHVELQSRDGASLITVRGELDLASSPALETELERAARSNSSLVIVDLRGLDFMDSTGLSLLVRANQQAKDNGQRFALVSGTSQVQRLLQLTGVADRLTVVEAPEELLGDSAG